MAERNKDLLEIFNDTWKANHNDDIKIKKEEEKRFINKMFDVKETEKPKLKIPDRPTMEARRINDQIEKTIKFEKQNEVKRFTDGYKND